MIVMIQLANAVIRSAINLTSFTLPSALSSMHWHLL